MRKLDGVFDEWRTLDRLGTVRDRVGDAVDGAPDLVAFSLSSDPDWIWGYLEFASPVTLQGLDHSFSIFFDVDASTKTGTMGVPMEGADLAIIFSPTEADRPSDGGAPREGRPQRGGEGTIVRAIERSGAYGAMIAPESIELGVAPAHASRQFEFRLARKNDGFMQKTTAARAMSVRLRPNGQADAIEEAARTQILLVPSATSAAPKAAASAVAKPADAAAGAGLRVATWNAERGALFTNPEPFGASLAALAPEVVLWQELGPNATAESLATWMNRHVPVAGATWSAVVSGGDLRTAVASTKPLRTAPFLDGLKRESERGPRDVRVAGALVETANGPVLAASLHLKCCGRLGSSEDETRTAESRAIHDAITKATAKLAADGTPLAGVVVGGDFNLVGDRAVLDGLAKGLDLDRSDLEIVDAMQLDGRTNTTWRSTGSPFLPSRLDWLLVSGSTLAPAKSFVFSTEDLAPEAVSALALPPSALGEASDHQVVVVDLAVPTTATNAPGTNGTKTP